MQYDLTRLNNNIVKSVKVDEIYSFTLDELKGTDLISLNDVKVDGEIIKNSLGNIEVNLDVEGIMVLPCAITLKPVNYPFFININGEVNELMEDFEENSINFKNSIDILPIIWENILMEIPMRVISDEAKSGNINLSGDGWKFVTDEEDVKSPFSELLEDMNSEVK